MFLEPRPHLQHKKNLSGWIEIICGSMFSGKTEELIRRVNRVLIAKQEVLIIKPEIDVRYSIDQVVSHNKNAIESIVVSKSNDIIPLAKGKAVVAIDEVQFFDQEIIAVCQQLANNGARVIVSGLDMDYEGKPFGYLPQLLCTAEYITKLHAVCMQCGDVASYSFRTTNSKEQVLLGEKQTYEARCRGCFVAGMDS